MMTEKIRVSASSVIRRAADTEATAGRNRRAGIPTSVPFGLMVAASSPVRQGLCAASLIWIVALPLATYIASGALPGLAPAKLFAFAVYGMGSVLCHQRPERSFHLWGVQLPVCARCVGVYAGAALLALAAAARAVEP